MANATCISSGGVTACQAASGASADSGASAVFPDAGHDDGGDHGDDGEEDCVVNMVACG